MLYIYFFLLGSLEWMELWLKVLKKMWGWRRPSTFSLWTLWRTPSKCTKKTASQKRPTVRWGVFNIWELEYTYLSNINTFLLCLFVQDVRYIFIATCIRDYVMIAAAIQNRTVPSGYDKGDRWAVTNTPTSYLFYAYILQELDLVSSKTRFEAVCTAYNLNLSISLHNRSCENRAVYEVEPMNQSMSVCVHVYIQKKVLYPVTPFLACRWR